MSNHNSDDTNKLAINSLHQRILTERAIPIEFALKHGLVSIDLGGRKKTEKEHKLKKAFPNLPYYQTTGLLIRYQVCKDGVERLRVRADETTVTIAGDEGTHEADKVVQIPRYICQADTSVAPYIPHEVFELANDVTKPLFVTEAPLKALSLTANGWPAIGMGGIYAGTVDVDIRKETDRLVAHPEMRRVRWAGRSVYIAYDAGIGSADDGLGNAQVAQAAARIWRSLSDLGAIVRLVNTPYWHEQQADFEKDETWNPTDQGPDDFIARKGVEAFQGLIDASVPADPLVRIREATADLKGADRAAAAGAILREPFVQACLSEASEATLAALGALPFLTLRSIKGVVGEFKGKLAAKATEGVAAWIAKLHRTATGNPKPSVENVEIALRNDGGLKGLLGFNEMTQAMVFRKEPPWKKQYVGSADTKTGDTWSDVDDQRLAGYMAEQFGILDVNVKKIQAATTVMGREASVNPVVDYLAGLTWDNTPRVCSWLTDCLGVEESEYSTLVGQWWLISAVARALRPGCQVDHVLVLEGSQGLSKSSALRVLGGSYFSEADLGDLRGKESSLSLQGSWIHEFKEGDVFSRATFRTLKGFITVLADDIIPKYSNKRVSLPRRNVFALSLNDSNDYLGDDENRRFWPVRCTEIDLDRLHGDRDQLWAEAVHLYKTGAKWWPSNDHERELCSEQQRERQAQDPWETAAKRAVRHLESTTVSSLLLDFGIPVGKQTRTESLRAARVLRAIFWIEGGGRKTGRKWVRGPDAEAQEPEPVSSEEIEELVRRREHLRLVESRADADDVQRLLESV